MPLRHGASRVHDFPEFPATVHVTDIKVDAELHYHKRLTETYYFLECGPDARMQLDDEVVPRYTRVNVSSSRPESNTAPSAR